MKTIYMDTIFMDELINHLLIWKSFFDLDKNLFCIEGGEYAGKSQVCKRFLKSGNAHVFGLPGGYKLGNEIRKIFKDKDIYKSDLVTYHLMCAADADFYYNYSNSKLQKKVILDRGWLSRLIYQGYFAEVIDYEHIFIDLCLCFKNILPCKTIVYTCSEETLLERMKQREPEDKYDEQALKINKAYLDFAKLIEKEDEEYFNFIKILNTDNLDLDQVYNITKEYFLGSDIDSTLV